MNKLVYLGLSFFVLLFLMVLNTYNRNALSLVWLRENKYVEKAKLCYMDTGVFLVYIKTEENYEDIARYVGTKCDTTSYDLDRPLPEEKIKNVIGLMN